MDFFDKILLYLGLRKVIKALEVEHNALGIEYMDVDCS